MDRVEKSNGKGLVLERLFGFKDGTQVIVPWLDRTYRTY